jgi:hypothetical protein
VPVRNSAATPCSNRLRAPHGADEGGGQAGTVAGGDAFVDANLDLQRARPGKAQFIRPGQGGRPYMRVDGIAFDRREAAGRGRELGGDRNLRVDGGRAQQGETGQGTAPEFSSSWRLLELVVG